MKGFLDQHELDIPCPSCSKTSKQKIARIKTSPQIQWMFCKTSFKLDAHKFRGDIAKVEAAMAKLSKSLGGK